MAVQRAVAAYHDKKIWRQLQKNGMARDFSWEPARSAISSCTSRCWSHGTELPESARSDLIGFAGKIRPLHTGRRRKKMIGDRIEVNIAGGLDIPLPRMVHIRQKFKTAEARQRQRRRWSSSSSVPKSAPRSSPA